MRRIAALSAVSVLALLLAACGQDAPGGMDAPPPADAPAAAPAVAPPLKDGAVSYDGAGMGEFAGDWAARGNEPFWRVDIKGTGMTLSRPEPPEVRGTSKSFTTSAGVGTWTGATADGRAMVVTLTKGDCSDGMSDLKYAYAAEFKLGDETFKGCGFNLAAEPREGQ